METVQYTISGAAKELHVEAHVLRYWEEELFLPIPRNKMGHRTYGEKEMDMFRKIMRWKEEGLSLKEIQEKCNPDGIPEIVHNSQVIPYPVEKQETAAGDDEKLQQFKKILGRIVAEAIYENSEEMTADIAGQVSTQVNKELDFLFREKEESDEKRFRQLDETIRSFQKARQEAAAAEIAEVRMKKRHRFSRKKNNGLQ